MDVPKVTALTNSPRAPSTRKHPSSCPPRIGVDESRWHGCVCGRGDQCRRVYERYLKVGHPLAVRLRVPPKLGPLKHRVKRQRMLDRSMVRFSRQRLLCHLGIHEKDLHAVADPRIYGHHFDEEVLQGVGWKPGGQVHWSKPVPGDVVERVSNRPIGAVQYDSANRLRHVGVSGDAIEKEGTISNGPFVVVPNVPLMSPLHSVVLGRYGTISPDSSGGEDNGKGVCRSLSYSGPSSAEPALRPSPRKRRIERLSSSSALKNELRNRDIAHERDGDHLHTALDKMKTLQETVAALQKQNVALLALIGQGVSRFNLCSPEWHSKHPNAARHLFGFQDWGEVLCYLWILWPELEPTIRREPEVFSPSEDITEFEKCLITKMRIHRAFKLEDLAMQWGRCRAHIGKIVREWAPKWGEKGREWSCLNLTPAYLRSRCPVSFKCPAFEKVVALADGKDFKCEVERSNTVLTRAGRSSKVEAQAFRLVTWSTPHGLTFEHTDLFLGRVSEKKLVYLWGPRLKMCPPGWSCLVDRGFAGTARYYPNVNVQITPSFLQGRKQFDAGEVTGDYEICKRRYSCEVVFARVTAETSLVDVVHHEFFSIVTYCADWAHAHANLYQPLQK